MGFFNRGSGSGSSDGEGRDNAKSWDSESEPVIIECDESGQRLRICQFGIALIDLPRDKAVLLAESIILAAELLSAGENAENAENAESRNLGLGESKKKSKSAGEAN